jgi:hypothetical protein
VCFILVRLCERAEIQNTAFEKSSRFTIAASALNLAFCAGLENSFRRKSKKFASVP